MIIIALWLACYGNPSCVEVAARTRTPLASPSAVVCPRCPGVPLVSPFSRGSPMLATLSDMPEAPRETGVPTRRHGPRRGSAWGTGQRGSARGDGRSLAWDTPPDASEQRERRQGWTSSMLMGGGKELCNFSDSLVLEAPIVALLKSEHEHVRGNVNRINTSGALRIHVVLGHGDFCAFREKTTL